MIESKRWTCSLLALVLALALLLGLFPFAPRTARAATIHYIGTASDLAAELAPGRLSDGDTIKLTANIDYSAGSTGNKAFIIDGVSVTLDLGGYTLNMEDSSSRGVEASRTSLTLADPANGEFNVTGFTEGLYAETQSTVQVTNVKGNSDGVCAEHNSTVTVYGSAEGTNGSGAYAFSNSTVIVHGDATGGGYGAWAGSDSTITVHGNATGGGYGARAVSTSTVTVHGNVTATNTNGVGAWAYSGGTITIDGAITANQYIGLGNASGSPAVIKLPSDFEPVTTKSGYYTYTDGTSTVWVKIPAPAAYSGSGWSPPDPSYITRTLTDPATGVTVTGYFAAGASLKVRQISLHAQNTCPACDEIRARQAAGEVIILYDISVSGGYSGSVEVSIPVGAQYNGQSVSILHCAGKTLETRTLTVTNGNAAGTFSGLSPFAVVKSSPFPAQGTVTGKRIDVYKLETLKTRLFRLSKGDAFTVLGLANGGRALFIELADGRQGYIALKDIGITFEPPVKATALKKAAAYSKQESGKLKRIGYYPKGQTLWIYGISGKYFINKQPDATYYLDAGQWRLSLSAASGDKVG